PQTAPEARLAKADQAASPIPTAPATAPPTATGASPQPSAPVSEQDRIAATLASGNVWTAIALFFGFGLLLALTPCVFPMIPILSGIIAGHGPGLSTRKAFWMSLTYVLAMSLTYAIAGLLAGLGGANLQAAFQDPWILSLFALVFVALALSMFGFYDLQLPSSLQTRIAAFSQRQQGGHLIGVAIMGVLSALIVGPCVAPPLAGALIFISQSGDALLGFAALFAMGLGMGAPLLAIGTSAGKLLPRAGAWMEAVKAVFGVALLGVAILLLERLLAPSVAMLLWGALLICSATYMGALHHLPPEASGWRKLWKGLGLVTLVYGGLMLVGAAAGGKDTLQPLRGLSFGLGAGTANAAPHASFKAIKGLADLERELAAAQASGRPLLLDFYADWCVSCKEMERYTFSDPAVAAEMARFVLLQADVTANDEEDQALMQGRFGIPGPPAILFFDPQGQERRDRRLVGFMPAAEFSRHLQGLRP
ncbi:MAG: protein-disulfide reductase DsbD, partial [Chromatiaceae bacterium]